MNRYIVPVIQYPCQNPVSAYPPLTPPSRQEGGEPNNLDFGILEGIMLEYRYYIMAVSHLVLPSLLPEGVAEGWSTRLNLAVAIRFGYSK